MAQYSDASPHHPGTKDHHNRHLSDTGKPGTPLNIAKINRIIKLGCFRCSMVFTYPTCLRHIGGSLSSYPPPYISSKTQTWCFAPHHPPAKVGEVKFRPGSWFDPAGFWKIPSVNGRYHGLPLMETSCEVSSTVDILHIYSDKCEVFWACSRPTLMFISFEDGVLPLVKVPLNTGLIPVDG